MISTFLKAKALRFGARVTIVAMATIFSPTITAGIASAQSVGAASETSIQALEVRGNQRIEIGTVLSYLAIEIGDPYSPERIDRSLKTLFATGLFADVSITRQGTTLFVDVVENPIINRVVFEGNKAIDNADFYKEIKLGPRIVYTRSRVQADLQRMTDLYRRKGRFAATIEPKIIQLPQNRVDLIYEINEGAVTGIRRINVLGNEIFGDRKLKKIIATKESQWWNLFASGDNYDPDRLTYDRELLRQFYEKNGYADFQVTSSVAEMAPDRNGFFITLVVDEGAQYEVGEIDVTTELDELNEVALKRLVKLEPGEVYNADKVEKSVDAITFLAGTVGYAFVDVRPSIDRDRENQKINVSFTVNEGPRVYVERIDIVGNTRTLDRVIRREMRLSEGDAYNRVRIQRSRGRIRALQFFEEVEIEELPGSQPDKTVVNVQVQEKPTGEFSFGFGFSSADQIAGDLSISERNLLGRGQFLRFRINASNRRQQVDISFTEPYLFGRNLVAGFDVFRSQTDFDIADASNYQLETTGLNLRTGFPLNDSSRLSVRYSLKSDNILVPLRAAPDPTDPTNPSKFIIVCDTTSVSQFICNEAGTTTTSVLGFTYFMDKRNDPLKPTKGYDLQIKHDIAGLGGDINYVRAEYQFDVFQKLHFDDVIGSLKLTAGVIESLNGDKVRLSDRFRKGGATFRGFEPSGIGPRDIRTQDGLGGKFYAIGTAEVSFPTGLPEEYGILASFFADFGTVGIVDSKDLNTIGSSIDPNIVRDDLSLRASVGLSVFWDSPFGPIRLDFAEVLLQEDYDKTESFRFSAGTRF